MELKLSIKSGHNSVVRALGMNGCALLMVDEASELERKNKVNIGYQRRENWITYW